MCSVWYGDFLKKYNTCFKFSEFALKESKEDGGMS